MSCQQSCLLPLPLSFLVSSHFPFLPPIVFLVFSTWIFKRRGYLYLFAQRISAQDDRRVRKVSNILEDMEVF